MEDLPALRVPEFHPEVTNLHSDGVQRSSVLDSDHQERHENEPLETHPESTTQRPISNLTSVASAPQTSPEAAATRNFAPNFFRNRPTNPVGPMHAQPLFKGTSAGELPRTGSQQVRPPWESAQEPGTQAHLGKCKKRDRSPAPRSRQQQAQADQCQLATLPGIAQPPHNQGPYTPELRACTSCNSQPRAVKGIPDQK